jgi:hypothetical protein
MRISTVFLILELSFIPSFAQARFHRGGPHDEPPAAREEVFRPRGGYVWVGGHYGWRTRQYVWAPGHYERERLGWEWHGGTWEHHDDHYDWHHGEWRRR